MRQRAQPLGVERLVAVAIALSLAGFAILAVRLALDKYFTIDELQYAHAAWLVAHGSVPYRDFFEVHHPLVYQVLSPVFLLRGDDPTAIVGLRAGMLAFLALACVSAARLNAERDSGLVQRGARAPRPIWAKPKRGPTPAGSLRSQSRVGLLAAALLAPLFLLALSPFVTLATEIRPDAAAIALFLAALAVLRSTRAGDRACAFASGLLLVGALWGSQKAAFYGSIFLPALVVDVAMTRRVAAHAGAVDGDGGGDGGHKRAPRLLRDPLWFVLGFVAGCAAVAAYLAATRSLGDWWSWCFVWAAEHERHYPGFPWLRYFGPILIDGIWVFALGLVGLVATLRDLRAQGRGAFHDPDLLLVAAVPSTFASFAMQRAPYPYSLLPFLAVVALFAARGAALLLGSTMRAPLRLAFGVLLLGMLGLQAAALERFVAASNRDQLAVLARVGALTDPSDAAYDNSGGYVSRPHASFYFYTDSYLRAALADTLARDVPRSIEESGAVLHLRDLRLPTLPPKVRTYLEGHFQPFDGDISLWGQHYAVPATGRLEGKFLAVRADRYFVSPPDALTKGSLAIDGRTVSEPTFALEKGEHAIVYTGPPGAFDLLWLPRDGKPWTPQRGLEPVFSRLF